MTNIAAALKAPFDPSRISWRVGSTNGDKTKGMALAYIDARDVMERLDDACGIENWQCSYPHANGKTVCAISIKIDGEWVSKSDGAGDTDFEAEKGALSDAFKRAAVRWGIGRYLYDMPAPWVAIEQRGKSFIIKEGERERLAAMLSKNAPPIAPQDDRPEDAKEAADSLIDLVKKCSSSSELADLKASAGFDGILKSLPEPQYRAVAAAYSQKKAELAPKAA